MSFVLAEGVVEEGVPVVVLSVPCRYIHSPSTVVKLSDVEAQFELCRALLKTF